MVEIVLGMVRASREGNCLLHLAMIKAMIPWTFAYDKLTYARYLAVTSLPLWRDVADVA